ncbi:uncharacterized protein RCC_02739 [Ramularia collo-cygni]|uniref:Uncharacterized protein n=1 Tax=Ramularia collo-cygni TaxID=112498 RepID=A0A2D3USU6_9PEZI|nr:uncharacterized protein RCC_02739 [Ramularia collo-cygni]CZT16905.1 uncharacterized protein RCC_02739 [Ramularia collo-cygni]
MPNSCNALQGIAMSSSRTKLRHLPSRYAAK